MPGHSKNEVKPENSPGHPSNHPHPISPASSTGSGSDSTVSGGSDNVTGQGSGSGSDHLVGRDQDRTSGSDDAAQGGRPRAPENTGEETTQNEGKRRDDEEETKPPGNQQTAPGDNAQTPGGQVAPGENSQNAGGQNTTDINAQNTGAQTAPDINAQNIGAQPPPMPEIDRSNAGDVMNTQSTYLNEQALRTADTAEAEAARMTQLAADARAVADRWRDSEYDGGFQDAQETSVSASSYYESLAQSFEQTAARNREIAQQNQAETTRVAELNAAGQAAVEQFNTDEANALAPVQSEGATADDYTHVADAYAQLQAEWKDKPANHFVQIPVGGSIQPANPAGYFERQERLFRRLASQAGDPEGGVTPGATSEVLYNRVTRGGEFVQDSQPTVSQYTADGRAGRVIAYQTADGRAAVGRGVFQPADPLYQGVTAGGELVQQSTPPGGTQYVDPDGRVVARRTNDGMVAISSGVFVPPDRQRGVDRREVPTATPGSVPFPDGAVQQDDRGIPIAGPQNVPFPDSAVQVDARGMPIATAQPVSVPEAQQPTVDAFGTPITTVQPVSAPEAQRPTVDDRGIPVATPQAVQLPANAVPVDAPGMPIATAVPTAAPGGVPFPDGAVQQDDRGIPVAGPQNVPFPDSAVQLDAFGTPIATAQPVSAPEAQRLTVDDRRMPIATPGAVQLPANAVQVDARGMPIATAQPVSPPAERRPEPNILEIGLNSYSPLGGLQAVQDYAATPAEMALPAVPLEDRAAFMREHRMSLPGDLVYQIKSPDHSPSWYDFPLAALGVVGGVGTPIPFSSVVQGGKLVAQGTVGAANRVLARGDLATQITRQADNVVPQGNVWIGPPGSVPTIIGTTNNPDWVITMYQGIDGQRIVAPMRTVDAIGGGFRPWGGGGGGGGLGTGGGGGGATTTGATYRTQGGLLIDARSNVIAEAPHPTSVAATEGTTGFTTTSSGLVVPRSAAAAADSVITAPATTSGVTPLQVKAPTVAPAAAPEITPGFRLVEPEVVTTAPSTTAPSTVETTRTVTEVAPPIREQVQPRVSVATPFPTITPVTNRGPVPVQAHGVAPRAVLQQAAQAATQTATSVAPSTAAHTSVSVTPKAQVPAVVPHTMTVTNTAPAVQPATGATTSTSANGLGPIPADGMKPPVRPPRKKRDHETQRPKDEPQQESDAPAGDHPHVSRWETRTVHELDHRTDEHTSEVVDDTNVRTFQVVERGAESTSGKKWQANHLEVTSNKGKATAAVVRFRRQPAETDVVDTADTADKPSRRDRFRARVQQGGQATRAGVAQAREKFSAANARAQQGARAARAGAVEARDRFHAANERAQPHIQNAGARVEQARTKFGDYQGKAQQVKGEFEQMLAKMQQQPQSGGTGRGRKKGTAKGKQKTTRNRQGTVTVKVQLVQSKGGGGSRGSGGTDKALARRLASGR